LIRMTYTKGKQAYFNQIYRPSPTCQSIWKQLVYGHGSVDGGTTVSIWHRLIKRYGFLKWNFCPGRIRIILVLIVKIEML
jgi:hypothetical protein